MIDAVEFRAPTCRRGLFVIGVDPLEMNVSHLSDREIPTGASDDTA